MQILCNVLRNNHLSPHIRAGKSANVSWRHSMACKTSNGIILYSGLLLVHLEYCVQSQEVQEIHRTPWAGPAESYKDDLGTEACLLKGWEEGTGPVQPAEEKAERVFHQCICTYVSEDGCQENGARLSLLASSIGTRGKRQNLMYWKFHPNIWKNFTVRVSEYWNRQVKEQISTREVLESLTADTRKLSGHNPEYCVLGKSYLSREFGPDGPTSGPFELYPFCHSVIL